MNEPQDPPPTPRKAQPEREQPPRTVSSEDLLQGAREVLIEHAGVTYRLRLTRFGKLILQK